MKDLKSYIHQFRIIERHRNPMGIFLRVPIYLLLFISLWNHNLLLIIIAILLEACLWTLVPPVTKSLAFIDKIIENELVWIKAKLDGIKVTSLLFLFAAFTTIPIGLWSHSRVLITCGFSALILFNLIMNYMVIRERRVRERHESNN